MAEIEGTSGHDTLTGTSEADLIRGLDGNDRLEDRQGGADTLDGGAGDDYLLADRTARSATGRPTLLGGAGNDEIRVNGGAADINGGDGDDRILLDRAAAGVTLGAGKDVLKLTAGSTAAVYDFNSSFDRLDFHALLGANLEGWDQTANPFTTGLASVESYYSGAYAQVLFRNGSGLHDYQSFLHLDKVHFNQLTDSALGGFTQQATAAATILNGTEAGETLYGTAGDNLIEGLGGADRIEGGFGADTLRGGEGDDYLNGQTGHDTVSGGAGNDHLVDDAGGGDTLNGDQGDDLIEATRAYKMVKRVLNLNGGDGADEIVYTQVADFHGQAGTGFTVNIDAGEGADLVRLGARSGLTTVTLGAGADTLRLAEETGGTINITDFQAGAGGDRIDLSAYLGAKLVNWNQSDNPFATGHLALVVVSATETALRVDLNGGGDSFALLATFKGTGAAGFTAANFLGFDPGGAAVAAGPGFAGTSGDDVAAGTAGADSLTGLAGDDQLSGGLGADVLDGGDGHDRLSGGGGADLLTGGDGDDLIEDVDGGNDQMSGGAGDDLIVITRAAAGTPGATVLADGGQGVDRFDVTSLSAAALILDGGAGDDVFRFFELMGSARVTLGEGRDVIRLDPSYFGPHTNQTRVKEIVVTDFQTGPGGDFVDLKEAVAYGTMHWPENGEGFRNGTLRLIQDGADTLVQYTYSSDGDYQTLFRFEGRQAAEFTRDNFGLDVPSTRVVDQAGAQAVNVDDLFGVPAVRITAANVHFTNALEGSVEGIGFFTPGGPAISIEASGATIVSHGAIRGGIQGSGFADKIFSYGQISGNIALGGGNDHYFERYWNLGLAPSRTVDMGAGDDSVELQATSTSLQLNLIGGAGYDTLTIRDIAGRTSAFVPFGTAGVERLDLYGAAGATIDFGGHPAVEDIHVYGGLILNVPNRPNAASTPYTLAPAGNLHLHGSHLTAGLNWSFKTITGSDLAEKVEFTSTVPLAAGTESRAVESISLGGGDDRLRWGGTQAQPGSADGGSGQDWLSVDLLAAVQDLSVFTGFETIEINNLFTNGSAPVRKISGIGPVTQRLLFTPSVSVQPPGMAFELEGVLPGLTVGAGQAQLTLLAGTTIAALSDRYLIDSTVLNASPQQIVNRGSILGAVALGGGNDSFANHGAVGGSVDLGEGNDLFTGLAGGSVAGTVTGGAGDDLYLLEAAYAVQEGANEGSDEIRTTIDFTAPANVENLTALNGSDLKLTGNGLANVLTGNSGANLLNGGAGNDKLIGGAGADTAVYSGKRSDYQIDTANGISVRDLNVADGDEGTDTLTDVEFIQFADVRVSLGLDSNNAPRLGQPAMEDQLWADGVARVYAIPETAFLDLDGETLTFRAELSNGSPLPAWLSFNAATQTFAGTPPVDRIGVALEVRVIASDGKSSVSDTVLFTVTQAPGAPVQGTEAPDTLNGTFRDEVLTGAGGDDVLRGSAGADRLDGGAGSDEADYSASPAAILVELPTRLGMGGDAQGDELISIERVQGSVFADRIVGGADANILWGGAGNDILDGGLGADALRGGSGDDIFLVDDAGDLVEENAGEGADEVRTGLATYVLPANVEKLTAMNDITHDFRGNGVGNVVTGGAAGDLFRLQDGGADTVFALDGNDGFIFGAAFTAEDKVDGGAGDNDQVAIQGDYSAGLTLAAHSLVNVETLLVLPGGDYKLTAIDANVAAGGRLQIFGTTLGATDDLTFDGSAETDGHFVFYGGAGRDTLTGGAGNDGFYFGPGNFSQTDTLHGGAGSNDQLGLDGHYGMTLGGNFDGIETLVLYRGPEADLNRFSLSTSDSAVAAGQRFTVFGTTLGTGLLFNGSAESDGSFRFLGSAQGDTLTGGQGNDLLFGGRGADVMTGGAGNDTFLYNAVAESAPDAPDRILDFAAGDKIDLFNIDAKSGSAADEAFSFIGSEAFGGTAGQLRLFQADGGWRVEGDVNGDGVADFALSLTTSGGYVPGAGDFLL